MSRAIIHDPVVQAAARELRAKGRISRLQLARELGISRSSVRRLLLILGPAEPRDPRDEIVHRYRTLLQPPSVIARRVRLSIDEVNRILDEAGVERRPTGRHIEDKPLIRLPGTRICSAYGCGAEVDDEHPICPDCLPRFDARPRRYRPEVDHAALERREG